MLPSPFTGALVLTGPTGSGKTQLGIDLARRLDAEIISVDSMALYRGMDIGTAKATPAQRESVRHHLIDVLEPWEQASVAWWLKEAAACGAEIQGRGKQVLFVGGTPLYLKALLFGLFEGPPADLTLRQRLTREAANVGRGALHQRLAQLDPASAARLHPNDLRRIIRALEVFELTGRPISEWQQQWDQKSEVRGQKSEVQRSEVRGPRLAEIDSPTPGSQLLTPDSCLLTPDPSLAPVLWLDLPRPVLYERINRRVEEMFAAGLVEEVRGLKNLGRPLGAEAAQAVGYREVLAHLQGQATLEETILRVQTRSRNLAKRQITWFRHLEGCHAATTELTWTLWQPKMKV